MSSPAKKVLRLIIPILLAVVLGWYAFSKFPISEVLPYVKKANIWWILFGVLLGVLSHLSRAYRWKYLLEPLGYKVHFSNSVMAVFTGYLTNFGIPRSGEVLRAAVLTNYEDVPFDKVYTSALIRSIQRAEGNPDCFRQAQGCCDQFDCTWRKYCLEDVQVTSSTGPNRKREKAMKTEQGQE